MCRAVVFLGKISQQRIRKAINPYELEILDKIGIQTVYPSDWMTNLEW